MAGRGQFAKVYRSLWYGTLRGDPWAQLVFVYMLASCDRDGMFEETPVVIRDATGLTLEQVNEGIRALEEADEDSRTPGNDGRRITLIDADNRKWGWRIVNYGIYRFTDDAERSAAYRHRASQTVTDRHAPSQRATARHQAEVEVEVEAEESSQPPLRLPSSALRPTRSKPKT